jgi:hypothetical protein
MVAADPGLPEALATRTGNLLLALATADVVVVVVTTGAVVEGVPGTVVVVVDATAEPELAGRDRRVDLPEEENDSQDEQSEQDGRPVDRDSGPRTFRGKGVGCRGIIHSRQPANARVDKQALPWPGSETVHWSGFPPVGGTPV